MVWGSLSHAESNHLAQQPMLELASLKGTDGLYILRTVDGFAPESQRAAKLSTAFDSPPAATRIAAMADVLFMRRP